MAIYREIENLFTANKYEEIVNRFSRQILGTISEIEGVLESTLSILYTSLVNAGYYLTAIERITKLLNESTTLSNNLVYRLLFLQCESCILSYNFEKGKEICDKLKYNLSSFKDIDEKFFDIHMDLIFSFFYNEKFDLEKSESKITELRKKENSLNFLKVLGNFYVKRALFLTNIHYFSEGFSSFDQALKVYSDIGYTFGIADVYYNIAYTYIIIDKLDLAVEYFQKSKILFEEIENNNRLAGVLSFLGYTYYKKNDLMKAEELILESLDIPKIINHDYFDLYSEKNLAEIYFYEGEIKRSLQLFLETEIGFLFHDNKKLLGGILNRIGRVYSSQGKFESALSYHLRAEEIFKALNDSLGIPWTRIYFGETLFEMGNFDSAITSWLTSYEEFKDLGNKHGLGFASLHLGKVFLILNDPIALNYYNEALDIFEEIQNLEGLVESYIGVGIILEEKTNLDQANKILTKARNIINQLNGIHIGIGEAVFKYSLYSIEHSLGKDNTYLIVVSNYLNKLPNFKKILQRKNFILALKLKDNKRLKDQYKSIELFETIVKEKEVIEYQTTLLSYLFLLESKIFELRVYNDENIITEANKLLEEMIQLTSFYNLSAWIAKIYALKASIKLIELQFDEAKKFLNEALRISVSKNMNRLAFQFSNQYDQMVNTIVDLENIQSNKLTLAERLEISNLTIFDPNRDKFNLEIPKEEPIYLSFITTSGMTLCSFNFHLNLTEDFDQLMSGFLVAINSVIVKLFSSSGFIERIKHDQYTITIYNLIDPIHICYVYKGRSYHAQLKLNELNAKLLGHPILQILIEASNQKRTLNQSETNVIQSLLDQTFK